MNRNRERGASRPFTLTLAVVTCVLAGSVVNRCLTCGAPAVAPVKTGVFVQGDLIDPGPTETRPWPDEVEPDPEARESRTLETLAERIRARRAPAEESEKKGRDGYKEITFDRLANWVYKFPDDPNADPQRDDPIPESIRKLNGEKVLIKGFMVPYKIEGDEVVEFLLVRNQFACCFGVVPQMNEFLHIKMEKGKRAPYAIDVVITVYGTFDARELIERGVVMSLYRIEASDVDEPPVFR